MQSQLTYATSKYIRGTDGEREGEREGGAVATEGWRGMERWGEEDQ